jgi:hypothetical protein
MLQLILSPEFKNIVFIIALVLFVSLLIFIFLTTKNHNKKIAILLNQLENKLNKLK